MKPPGRGSRPLAETARIAYISSMLRTLIICAALVVIFAGIKAAATLVVPFLLAVFLAVLLTPAFLRLQSAGLPVPLALTVMIVGLFALGTLAVTILRTSLDEFTANLPAYEAGLRVQISAVWAWVEAQGIQAPDEFVTEFLNPQFAMSYAGRLARALSGMLGLAFIIVIITAFMLVEASGFHQKLAAIDGMTKERIEAVERNIQDVRRYMSLKSVMSLLTGALVLIWLWFLDIDNALFMGLLAFFLNFVPNIGSFIAAIPGILLGFILYGPGMAAISAIGYVAINVGISNGIEPRFMGTNLGISPLIVVLSLVFWGWLLGPVGMLLSVPLTMVVKVILESAEATRSVAVLLGPPLRGNRDGAARQPGE
ncbi:MAG: AI-2E family transporter [Pseudomonadota bacterium]